MNKKIISLSIFAGLFCVASLALGAGLTDPLGTSDFGSLLARIAREVGYIISGLGTVMIIVAGILYLTSAGSPERIGTAKKALVYAIVGITIGLAATSIVEIVTGMLKG